METEFKYRLDEPGLIDKIINDPILDEYVNRDNLEDIKMHAVYFDTADQDFRKAGIAYRIRYENDRITATIKWDNHVRDGLHAREEFNLVVNDDRFAEAPDIKAFESSDAYDVLCKAAGDQKLIKFVEMDFTRKLIKIDTGASISALSIDQGVIHGVSGNIDVLEMEVEWYYGNEADFVGISEQLASKFNLVPEDLSKLQRGFMSKEDLEAATANN